MNVFVYPLEEGWVDTVPDVRPTACVVEDNIGEGIHIHLRNLRVDMTVDDFDTFAKNIEKSTKELGNGNH